MNTYVVKIMPGVYDIGDVTLLMKPYVNVIGAGKEVTVIMGGGNYTSATNRVMTTSNSRISSLTVESYGGIISIGILARGGTISDVNVIAYDGVMNTTAVSFSTVETAISDSNISAISTPNSYNYAAGINVNSGGALINDSSIEVSGQAGGQINGVVSAFAGIRMNNVKITATDTGDKERTKGLYIRNSQENELYNVDISSDGMGIDTMDQTHPPLYLPVNVRNSRINGGLSSVSGDGSLNIVNSQIIGPWTNSVQSNCLGNYDGDYSPIVCN